MSFQKKKKKNKKKIDKQITNVYCISCNITNKQTRHKIYFTENEIILARIMRSSYKFPFLEIYITLCKISFNNIKKFYILIYAKILHGILYHFENTVCKILTKSGKY